MGRTIWRGSWQNPSCRVRRRGLLGRWGSCEGKLKSVQFAFRAICVAVVFCLAGCGKNPGSAAERANAPSTLVERVGSTGFIQLEANSFNKLTPREQALAY